MVESVRASGIGGPARLPRDAAKTVAGQFAVDDRASPLSQPSRLTTISGIGLESMLALQAVDEAAERNRAAQKRGTAMIAALTRLQHATLADTDPSLALNILHELASNGATADDPGLGAILQAVVLRSRVEIARREHVMSRLASPHGQAD